MLSVFHIGLVPEIIYGTLLFFALVFSFFLYYRSGKHELVDSQILFDLGFFSIAGGLVFGRIVHFVTNPTYYSWSISKLLFFNVWPGFSYFGALLGIILSALFYLRKRKENFWVMFDLASFSFAFFQSATGLAQIVSFKLNEISVNLNLVKLPVVKIALSPFYFIYFLVLFWVLKRLAKRKRFDGFFICFYLFFASFFETLVSFARDGEKMFAFFPRAAVLPSGFFVFSAICWYMLSKRKILNDFKASFAFILIGFFNFKRVFVSADEAGKLSRAILFSPFYLIRSLYSGLLGIVKEVTYSFAELFQNFKTKR